MSTNIFSSRWQKLCDVHLPLRLVDSVWRFNRRSRIDEPSQGWKLHVSASILDACDVLTKVAPILAENDVQYKAPCSLEELMKINSGLHYGYPQVGKFITVYPRSDGLAIHLAEALHRATESFSEISVPFDDQYLPGSNVFYRYGAFTRAEKEDDSGETFLAITDSDGNSVPDDRLKAKPDWVADIFQQREVATQKSFDGTPLGNKYRIFRALTQRGKGGTYLAIDISQDFPRLVIVKEGRKHGEMSWNGQDGRSLIENEFQVLGRLHKSPVAAPEPIDAFEVNGNFYLVVDHIPGKSLKAIMDTRRRRFSMKQVLQFGIAIAEILKDIHAAGWIWNDCKPANLIISENRLRPIDFEGAYPIGLPDPFDWRSKAFSTAKGEMAGGPGVDLYALGTVLYFLVTGRLFDSELCTPIATLRRNVPRELCGMIEAMVKGTVTDLEEVIFQFKKIGEVAVFENGRSKVSAPAELKISGVGA